MKYDYIMNDFLSSKLGLSTGIEYNIYDEIADVVSCTGSEECIEAFNSLIFDHEQSSVQIGEVCHIGALNHIIKMANGRLTLECNVNKSTKRRFDGIAELADVVYSYTSEHWNYDMRYTYDEGNK
jgi:hypothetical protein